MRLGKFVTPVVHYGALVVVALLAFDIIAGAENAVAPVVPTAHDATSVNVGGAYVWLEPYIMAVFTAVLSALTAIVFAWFQKKTGLDVDRQAVDRINLACENAAGRILASQESTFAHARVDVHSELVARELPKVLDYASQAVDALGWTPEHVRDTILAKVGNLQARASAGPVLDAPH